MIKEIIKQIKLKKTKISWSDVKIKILELIEFFTVNKSLYAIEIKITENIRPKIKE